MRGQRLALPARARSRGPASCPGEPAQPRVGAGPSRPCSNSTRRGGRQPGLARPSAPPAGRGCERSTWPQPHRAGPVAASFLEPVDGATLPRLPSRSVPRPEARTPRRARRTAALLLLRRTARRGRYRIAVKREPGAGSAPSSTTTWRWGTCSKLAPAATSRSTWRGPGAAQRRCRRDPRARHARAVARAASNRAAWWVRTRAAAPSTPSQQETRDLLARLPAGSPTCATAARSPRTAGGVDFDEAGRIDLARCSTSVAPREADFFLCGPSDFLRELTAALLGWGVEPERLHRAGFGLAPARRTPDPIRLPGHRVTATTSRSAARRSPSRGTTAMGACSAWSAADAWADWSHRRLPPLRIGGWSAGP